MAYRYRSPSLLSNLGRLSGYNATRGRDQVAARPLAAQVTQAAREREPVFETPPPEAPLRAPAPAEAPDAGLALQPDIQAALQDPSFGTMVDQPFAQQALKRGMASLAPMVTTADPALASADISTLGGRGVGELGAPDLATLAEDPAALTQGERVGRAAADIARESHFNPQAPDAHQALPGIFSAAHETIKETDAQRAMREAIGKDKAAHAAEVPENAKSHRALEGARAGLAGAQKDELPLEGASKREHRTAQDVTLKASAGLKDEQAKTEPSKRADYTSKGQARAAAADAAAAHNELTNRYNRFKGANTRLNEAHMKPKGGMMPWSGPNERAPAEAAAQQEVDAATAALNSPLPHGTLPPPAPPPNAVPGDQPMSPEQRFHLLAPEKKAARVAKAKEIMGDDQADAKDKSYAALVLKWAAE